MHTELARSSEKNRLGEHTVVVGESPVSWWVADSSIWCLLSIVSMVRSRLL